MGGDRFGRYCAQLCSDPCGDRPHAKICCVVKADAYGHGVPMVAKVYERLGADWFAVSNLEEAIQLRRCGITRPILILGYTPPQLCDGAGCARVFAKRNFPQYARNCPNTRKRPAWTSGSTLRWTPV